MLNQAAFETALSRMRAHLASFGAERQLLGTTTAERDAWFDKEFTSVKARVADLRALGKAGRIDAAGMGFVPDGDDYVVSSSGEVTRELNSHPVALGALTKTRSAFSDASASQTTEPAKRQVSHGEVALDTLLAAHASAWFAPSATNWQPVRVVVSNEAVLRHTLAPGFAWRDHAPVLLIFRRPQYVSLLGDILELYGLSASAYEEQIDTALYLTSLGLLLNASDVSYSLHRSSEVRTAIAAFSPGSGFEPFGIVRLVAGLPQSPTSGAFTELAKLMRSRSSHRVASPTKTLSASVVKACSDRVEASQLSSALQVVWIENTHAVVPQIGEAMFAALYGDGADRATKAGGVGGMLAAFSPDALAQRLAIRGLTLDSPVDQLGEFLAERLLEGGRYHWADGANGRVLQSSKGEPLSYKMLARLTRTFASAMGTFFLQFKNTHPVLGIVMAKRADDNGAESAYAAGEYACRMLLAGRANGWASIIKTGPIDLAESRIEKLLVQHGLIAAQSDLRPADLRPALMLQFGWPIGDEPLDPANPEAQSGLGFRERDKRPPRLDPCAVVSFRA